MAFTRSRDGLRGSRSASSLASGWAHTAAWVLAVLLITGGIWLWSIAWFEHENGPTAWYDKMDEGLGYKQREIHFTPAELAEMKAAHAEPPEPADEAEEDTAEAPSADEADYEPEAPKAYKRRAYGWNSILALTFMAPLVLIGLMAIGLTFFKHVSICAPAAYLLGHRVRMVMNTPLPPRHFWRRRFNGVTIMEAAVWFVFFAMEWVWFIIFLKKQNDAWNDGEAEANQHAVKNATKAQYWLRWIAVGLGVLFFMTGPLLFLPVARGSLLTTFLGVKYGTAIKWHRWLGAKMLLYLILHGALYHVLWASDGVKTYRREAYRFEHKQGFSNGAGLVSWAGAVALALTSIPAVRRKVYWVFYRVHIVGAALFTLFGIVHYPGAYETLMAGLVVYGIDFAYRFFQMCFKVQLRLASSAGGRIVSIAIPLQDNNMYHDGCHVWICVPRLGWLEYHPFSVSSSPADPHWLSTMLVETKVYDRWTEDLAAIVKVQGDGAVPTCRVQGPFQGENMPAAAERTYSHLVFFAGGIGITAVLPAIKRAAMRRSGRLSGGDDVTDAPLPPLKVVFTCRNECELRMLSALLPHADVITLVVHYTGKTALAPRTLEPPLPGDASAPLSSADVQPARAQSSARHEGTAVVPHSRRLRRVIAGRGLEATVLFLTFFAAYWLVMVADFWQQTPAVQLEIANYDSDWAQKRRRKGAVVWALTTVLIVPLLPLTIVAIWNALKPGRTSKRRGVDGAVDSQRGKESSDGKVTATAGDGAMHAPTDPSADARTVMIMADGDGGLAVRSAEPGALPVPVAMGRPDIAGAFSALGDGYTGGNYVGVWTAGPKGFNTIVEDTAKACGRKVDVHQMAFDL